ncbi:hypothetical protein NQZ68_024472 [Dissostichus eleginoides]|nr:hypothetical protein NQZ68_024472 [Dissostichus eleginoides]
MVKLCQEPMTYIYRCPTSKSPPPLILDLHWLLPFQPKRQTDGASVKLPERLTSGGRRADLHPAVFLEI